MADWCFSPPVGPRIAEISCLCLYLCLCPCLCLCLGACLCRFLCLCLCLCINTEDWCLSPPAVQGRAGPLWTCLRSNAQQVCPAPKTRPENLKWMILQQVLFRYLPICCTNQTLSRDEKDQFGAALPPPSRAASIPVIHNQPLRPF